MRIVSVISMQEHLFIIHNSYLLFLQLLRFHLSCFHPCHDWRSWSFCVCPSFLLFILLFRRGFFILFLLTLLIGSSVSCGFLFLLIPGKLKRSKLTCQRLCKLLPLLFLFQINFDIIFLAFANLWWFFFWILRPYFFFLNQLQIFRLDWHEFFSVELHSMPAVLNLAHDFPNHTIVICCFYQALN